jgi:hypothetical protein
MEKYSYGFIKCGVPTRSVGYKIGVSNDGENWQWFNQVFSNPEGDEIPFDIRGYKFVETQIMILDPLKIFDEENTSFVDIIVYDEPKLIG